MPVSSASFSARGSRVAEDANADQAHDRGDEVAVAIEIGEGGVGVGRAALDGVIKIHGDAGDQLIEQLKRNGEARGGVAHGEEDRIGSGCACGRLRAMRPATLRAGGGARRAAGSRRRPDRRPGA